MQPYATYGQPTQRYGYAAPTSAGAPVMASQFSGTRMVPTTMAAAPVTYTGQTYVSGRQLGATQFRGLSGAPMAGTRLQQPTTLATQKPVSIVAPSVPESPAAPYLKEFYAKQLERTAGMDFMAIGMSALAGDKATLDAVKNDAAVWFETVGKPLLIQSFQLHDSNGDGVLDQMEGQVFFGNLMSENLGFVTATAEVTVGNAVKQQMSMMAAMIPPDQRQQVQQEMDAAVQMGVMAAKADANKRMNTYKTQKSQCDAAAFKVMDINGDGCIQIAEFLACLEPESDKNADLMVALGFMTEQEKLLQQSMKQYDLLLGNQQDL